VLGLFVAAMALRLHGAVFQFLGNSLDYLRGEWAFQCVAVNGLPAAPLVWGAMQFKGRGNCSARPHPIASPE
jgi:hypothetical protein